MGTKTCMREVIVRVDRSRMVDYRNCPRLRYNRYHRLGSGVTIAQESEALTLGDAAHKAVERLWTEDTPPDQVLNETIPLGSPKGVALWLALRSWAHYRLPVLKADYDVVLVEREIEWELGRQRLVKTQRADGSAGWEAAGWGDLDPDLEVVILDMIRVDAILRSRMDDGLYYFELKTTNQGSSAWAQQWTHNTQVLVNCLALEETLHERIEGVLIEGILKDDRWAVGYVGPGGQRSWTYKAKWDKVAITDPAAWWPLLDEADWASACLPVPPIRPIPAQLARKRRQLLAQEVQIWQDLQRLEVDPDALDVVFPHHDDHCHRYFRHPCEMLALCWTQAVAHDPLGSHLYTRRVPHHPGEHA